MTAATRLRLLVATDNPQIFGYDQDQFARKLYYDRPIAASLEAFKAARRSTGEILERMTDADWARAAGTHTEHGRFTAERWLELPPCTPTRTPSRSSSLARRQRRRESSKRIISVTLELRQSLRSLPIRLPG